MVKPTVSVVMPVYNEEKYIRKCIESLLLQDYPVEDMEWIFVDGDSGDKTVQIINEYAERHPGLIQVYSNPKKIVPYAMNIGIAASKGKYIVRLDAHADYAPNYISQCVQRHGRCEEIASGACECRWFQFRMVYSLCVR